MSERKLGIPTTYVVSIWNEDGSEIINQEFYPIYKYSLTDVFEKLVGREHDCDIEECRFSKRRNRYHLVGRMYTWDNTTLSWIITNE